MLSVADDGESASASAALLKLLVSATRVKICMAWIGTMIAIPVLSGDDLC